MSEKIQIKYFASDIEPLKAPTKSANWVDLRAAKDVEIKKGEFTMIPLGVAMKLPEGYEALVAPRSSTYKNFGVIQVNSIGIIDETYCGDEDQWFYPVLAMRDTVIHKNDRICQFRIISHQPALDFEIVDRLDESSRGGFGSTGVK